MKYIVNLINNKYIITFINNNKEKEYFMHCRINGSCVLLTLFTTNIKLAKKFDTEAEAHEFINKYYTWEEDKKIIKLVI